MTYKIVTDSSSDLLSLASVPFEAVPLKIQTAEREFTDCFQTDVDEMLSYLAAYRGRSGSACPNTQEWLEAFGDAENVFCVTITSGLSGSYNAASVAAREYMESHEDRHVFVLDSLSTGAESALLIEKLRELILQELSFEDIVAGIKQYVAHTHLLFSLESLHNLANNGRVSMLTAKFAGLIGIRVVGCASAAGTLEILEKARGNENALRALMAQMQANGYCGGRVRIHHCQNVASAEALAQKIHATYPKADITIAPTRALCSFYAERGGLLVGYEDTV